MITLGDILDSESKPAVSVSGPDNQRRLIPAPNGSYDLAVQFANEGLTWTNQLDRLATRTEEVDAGNSPPLRGTVPFLPAAPMLAAVYSFGYTHSEVNGIAVEKGKLDFYYKGPGSLLVTDGAVLVGTSLIFGGGIEVEYCAIYCVNDVGSAVYLGYALANDFSDTRLRAAHRNLANLSKLHPSVVSSEVVLDRLPATSRVDATVERAGTTIWQREGILGSDAMIYSQRLLERLLLQRRNLFAPGMIVYLLLGSCISSHKDGLEMRDGDAITIRDHGSGLSLSNTLAS